MDAGVQLLRVHDVAETVQALRVWRGLRDAALTDFAQLPDGVACDSSRIVSTTFTKPLYSLAVLIPAYWAGRGKLANTWLLRDFSPG